MRLAATVVSTARRLLDLLLLAAIAAVLVTIIVTRIVPALTGTTTLVIAGRSMEPAIPLGSVVVAVPVAPGALRVGDVVSLTTGPGRATFTHRIERMVARDGDPWIATRGDANASPDPSIVPATAVIGRIEVTIPMLGYLVTILSSTPGILFALGLVGSLLVAAWLLEGLELDQRAVPPRGARNVGGGATTRGVRGTLALAVPGGTRPARATRPAASGEPVAELTPAPAGRPVVRPAARGGARDGLTC